METFLDYLIIAIKKWLITKFSFDNINLKLNKTIAQNNS